MKETFVGPPQPTFSKSSLVSDIPYYSATFNITHLSTVLPTMMSDLYSMSITTDRIFLVTFLDKDESYIPVILPLALSTLPGYAHLVSAEFNYSTGNPAFIEAGFHLSNTVGFLRIPNLSLLRITSIEMLLNIFFSASFDSVKCAKFLHTTLEASNTKSYIRVPPITKSRSLTESDIVKKSIICMYETYFPAGFNSMREKMQYSEFIRSVSNTMIGDTFIDGKFVLVNSLAHKVANYKLEEGMI